MLRPRSAPRKIPLWAWAWKGWIDGGRKGPRPPGIPRRIPLWAWLWLRWKRNPAPIDPSNPDAPQHDPLPKPPNKPTPTATFHHRVVYYANMSLGYAGRMAYTENWTLRQRFFYFSTGKFAGASADCSQYVCTILHWCGSKSVTSKDYTGTLLAKGRPFSSPVAGRVAVWGPGTGAHTAFVTEKTEDGRDWYCVGFGHQGAPNRVTLSAMSAYFHSIGQPGVRYLDFAP